MKFITCLYLALSFAVFAVGISSEPLIRKGEQLQSTDFFVAPNGSDVNPGTKELPFATLVKARDAIRAAKKGGDKGSFTVELRAGTYMLAETLTLTSEDSGTVKAPVVWRSTPGEHAVISGGQAVVGFQETQKNGVRRWTVDIPDVKSGGFAFRQLFVSVNGQSLQRRYRPHIGMKRVDGLTYSPKRKGAMSHRAAQRDFYFAPGDFKQWENLTDVEVVVLHVWSSSRLFVQEVDTEKNIVTFTGMPTFAVNQGGLQPYFIENVKEELDEPGEWYLDRSTGVLTYLPLEGESLADTRIVIPRLAHLLMLTGDYQSDRFVSDIEFREIGFSLTESKLPREGYGGSQGHPDLPAAIELTGAKHCSFVRCTLSHSGNYGIAVGMGSHANRVVGCRFFDLGGGGVKVGDIRMNPTDPYPVVPTGNRIENCAISDCGIMYYSANAVWCGIVRDTVIRNNQIWDLPYSGIAVGWSWSDKPTACGGNQIVNNHISHVLNLIADGASIYTLGRQPGTVIRGNVLRDNLKSPFAKQYWQLGLYLDEGSSEILVENNFVYHVGTHGFNMNGGAQNLIQNNILGPVYGNEAPYIRSYKKSYAKENVFTRNVMYFDGSNMTDADLSTSLFNCRSNIYWNFEGQSFHFAGKSFKEWQAGGQDIGSLNTDPLFEDPVQGDFRLRASSPAFALGFEPFDISAAGLEPAFKDVARPAKVVKPPFYSMALPQPKKFAGFFSDCEDIPVGLLPRGFSCNGGSPKANFKIAEGFGRNGGRAIVAIDKKSAAKSFYPYMTYRLPEHLDGGVVTLSFDMMQKADSPAFLDVGFRDTSKRVNPGREFNSASGVTLSADGILKTGSHLLATTKPGSWIRVEIALALSGDNRESCVTITLDDGTKKVVKAPLSKDFAALSMVGFFCSEAADGIVYLDNMRMTVMP
ncbi:MAG: right-handed parallel beta-helix repeat-containing protein [Kiritimatiellae bacterium]|jgi:hypothetical protein|nr:right-handed parallel beta-helix repeat-containing protein [Kiritimatiellia bacterium]